MEYDEKNTSYYFIFIVFFEYSYALRKHKIEIEVHYDHGTILIVRIFIVKCFLKMAHKAQYIKPGGSEEFIQTYWCSLERSGDECFLILSQTRPDRFLNLLGLKIMYKRNVSPSVYF